MRGFRFVGLWPTKLLVAREKKPLVPRVACDVLSRTFTSNKISVSLFNVKLCFVLFCLIFAAVFVDLLQVDPLASGASLVWLRPERINVGR